MSIGRDLKASYPVQLAVLENCVEEGFLDRVGDGGNSSNNSVVRYRWIHDKIQEAAFSLIEDEDEKRNHSITNGTYFGLTVEQN